MIPRAAAVASLLFVSGACALVFQTAWLREFRLVFGSTTAASAAVVAIFMGGLGLGNAVLGKRADISPNPLRLYAGLEMAISVTAMISPFLILATRAIYIAAGGQETLGLIGATILRLLLATLVLGPATFLMGGTLPSAARSVTQADDTSRRSVGLLYGMNTLGAVVGALLGTFLLLEAIGTRATLWAACSVNLLNSVAAWKLAQMWGDAPQRAAANGSEERRTSPAVALLASTLYAIAAAAGFVFFLMELVWYRMLGPILGGTTFTFGLILAVALAGIGIGGALYPLLYRDRQPDLRSLVLTLAWEALAIAVPFTLGDRIALLAGVLRPLGNLGLAAQFLGWLIVTLIVVFPAALISGVQFPILIALLGRGDKEVGRQVGYAFGWNTVGAILGSLAGGFGLMTALSAPGVWKLAVLALCLLALALLVIDLRSRWQAGRLLVPLGVVVASGLCLFAIGPTAVWRHGGIGAGRAQLPLGSPNDLHAWINATRRNVIWQMDGRESSVAISSRRGIGFIVNGKSDGDAIHDAGTQIMLGVLGALLHPQPRHGLVIGLGTGESAGWLAHQPGIERVDVVELEPAIGRVAELCSPINHDVLRHPKVRVIINDARETLLTTQQQYDLIASEPSNPYRSGVASLYTREFYQAVRQRLNPDGLFLQWLQGYEIDISTFRMVLCTLGDIFPHVEIWETNPSDMVLVASQEPRTYTASGLKTRMSEPAMREALHVAWRTTTLEGVLSHLIATDEFTRAVAAQQLGRINTDDRNRLEFGFARTVGLSGGFTVTGLRMEAASAQAQRPARLEQEIDWEAVEDARIAYHACSDTPLSPTLFSGPRAVRAEALLAFQSRPDLAGVAAVWRSQPKPPRDLSETLAVALGLAAQGNERATELIQAIRADCPIEASVVDGILAMRLRDFDAAAQALATAFAALRKDPTPIPTVVEHALRAALELADRDPRQLRAMYDALREPFAVMFAQERRITALCFLGQRLGAQELADAFALSEPYPVWDDKLLELRALAYERTANQTLARARRELDQFRSRAREGTVLAPVR
jgi:spermidine synthase